MRNRAKDLFNRVSPYVFMEDEFVYYTGQMPLPLLVEAAMLGEDQKQDLRELAAISCMNIPEIEVIAEPVHPRKRQAIIDHFRQKRVHAAAVELRIQLTRQSGIVPACELKT